jgi:DNA-binding SARP family transcriptional activator
VEIRLLGPVEISAAGQSLAVGGPQLRLILAALAVDAGRTVTTENLINRVWDNPPAGARRTLHVQLSGIRKLLERAATMAPPPVEIEYQSSGYCLDIDPDRVDLRRFADLARQARDTDCPEHRRAELLDAALSLWQGEPLAGLSGEWAARTRQACRRQHLDTVLAWADLHTRLGNPTDTIGSLTELLVQHPLVEPVSAALIRALHAAGRTAEALDTYACTRRRLVEELGADPGPELQSLHQAILCGQHPPTNGTTSNGHLPIRAAPTNATSRPRTATGVARTRDSQPAEAMAQSDHAVRHLAAAVTRQWTAEAEMRSLNRPEPIPVTWSSTGRPVSAVAAAILGDRTGMDGAERFTLSGNVSDVVAKFRQIPSRQLVVLGEPGAGKSVLAILLTLGLLADRQAGEPVPVLFPLASWNPHREHLHHWLAARLVEEYPGLANTAQYGPQAATRLVLDGRIIPVLDGLDETPPALHAVAIDALDHAMAGGQPLMVTCRSAEYELAVKQSGAILTRAAVVEIEPVELNAAIAFLTAHKRAGETRWDTLVGHLRRHPGGALAQALRTPLMVDLARTAYTRPDTDPDELCDTTRFCDRGAIEGFLLDRYLPAVYARRPSPPAHEDRPALLRPYDPGQAERWLAFLARHLHRQQTWDLAWWRLDRALPRRTRGLLMGLPPGPLFAVSAGLAAGPVIGLIYGLSFAIAGCVAHGIGRRSGPLQVELRFRQATGRFLRRYLVGVMVGITFGLSWALSVELVSLLAVVFGFAIGLLVWLDTPVDADRVTSPATVLRNDRTATLAFTLSFMVSLGLFDGVAFAFTQETRFVTILEGHFDLVLALAGGLATALLGRFLLANPGAVAYGLAGAIVGGQVYPRATSYEQAIPVGIVFGLAAGLGVLLARAWGGFTVTRLWLALRGQLPLQLMRFLDDAHRRGVLRQVGAVYQFRHARLQDRLAGNNTRSGTVRRRPGDRHAPDRHGTG